MSIGFVARSLLTKLSGKELRSCRTINKCCTLYCNYYQEVSCKEHVFVWSLCLGLTKITVAAQENESFTNPSDEIENVFFCALWQS